MRTGDGGEQHHGYTRFPREAQVLDRMTSLSNWDRRSDDDRTGCLAALGVWLIDNANLEQLAEECQRNDRYEFMLSMAPLVLRNATGSPVNPIAIF